MNLQNKKLSPISELYKKECGNQRKNQNYRNFDYIVTLPLDISKFRNIDTKLVAASKKAAAAKTILPKIRGLIIIRRFFGRAEMKKIFVVFAFLCVCFFVSCENSLNSKIETAKTDADLIDDSDKTDSTPQDDEDISNSTVDDGTDSTPDDDGINNSSNDGTNETVDDDSGNTSTGDGDNDTAPDNDTDNNGTDDSDPVVIVESLDYESGFIFLEENSYTLDKRTTQSGRAAMWYYFQPADENPDDKPLFVFYNGGPGSASRFFFSTTLPKKRPIRRLQAKVLLTTSGTGTSSATFFTSMHGRPVFPTA